MKSQTVWKGSINFGLVSIPIDLYSAVQPHSMGFKMLHSRCNTPINTKRWCAHCNKEIAWEEISKGLELPDGTYFIMTKDNLEKLRPEKTDTMDVMEFVETNSVPPVYYNQHYYVIPQKAANKAFFLFVQALKEFKKDAIAQFVLRDKDHVCLIQPYRKALLMTTLNFSYEIKELELMDALKVPGNIDKQELELAKILMEKLYKKTFDMSRFKDSFAERLTQTIKQKKGGKILKIKETTSEPEVSLMDALRSSLKKYDKKPAASNKN